MPSGFSRTSEQPCRTGVTAWHSSWTNSFAGIRIWRAAPPTCGATFDAAHPGGELKTIEERVASPDFWKDQAAAQKILQRRRRLEDDRALASSLRKRADDLDPFPHDRVEEALIRPGDRVEVLGPLRPIADGAAPVSWATSAQRSIRSRVSSAFTRRACAVKRKSVFAWERLSPRPARSTVRHV